MLYKGEMRVASILLALASLVIAQSARAARDYDPSNAAWNGGARLVALARDAHLDVRPTRVLDLSRLSLRSAIFFLGPRRPPPDEMLRFVRLGGRIAIADDSSVSRKLLARFGLEYVPSPPAAMALGGLPHLAIAYPRGRHLLTFGVDMLVTNHAAGLRSSERLPLYSFGSIEGLVVVQRDGDGELVALGDPSLFTNQMLAFGDNEHFAVALVRYLVRGTRARPLYIVHGDFEVQGSLPAHLVPRTRTELLAASARSLAEEAAYGVNTIAAEMIAQRPVRGVFMALAVFAGGGALLVVTALWAGGVRIGARREPGHASATASVRLEDLDDDARMRIAVALRREIEERLAADGRNETDPSLARLRAAACTLPAGIHDPIARAPNARGLRRIARLARAELGLFDFTRAKVR
jgi:hypothetical protein